jgi:hypothetical protein
VYLLSTITTTSSDWRDKAKEIKKLRLKEISIFPTCLDLSERRELYELLKKTNIERIPFVHLKSDMELWELDYLVKNYHTKVFNTHTRREYPIPPEWQKYRKMIYIENTYFPFDEKEIEEFAGICLDMSHLEARRIYQPEKYIHDIKIIEKHNCGCSHIGPTKDWNFLNKKETEKHPHPHILKDLSELDYLKKYPLWYFGAYVALEMENSLEEQLKAKDYIIKLLKI